MHVAVEGAGPTLVHFGPPTPATPLQVALVRHGKTDVEWFASGQAVVVADRATLAVSLDASILNSGDCLEVRAHDDSGCAIELDEVFFTHGSDGWLCTPDRPEELQGARTAHFALPLIAPNATTAARSFRAVALIEGLLLTQNTRVPGIEIYALQQALGSEQGTVSYLRDLTNAMFGSTFSAEAHSDRGLPCVALKFSDVRADTAEMVLRFFNLMEGMSKGSLGVKADVLDAQGEQLFQSNGQPYTTKEARGAVYMVIAGLCRFRGDFSEDGFCPHTPLWELCQHWTTVRNQVAHAGAWDSDFKVGGTANVDAFLNVAPGERRADLESVLARCVRFVVDGVIFRGYLPL